MAAKPPAFDDLPLFASEADLALVILGRGHMCEWTQVALYFERKGLPAIDPIVGRRYRPAVKKFFDKLWNLDGSKVGQDGRDLDGWNMREKRRGSSGGRARMDAESQFGARDPTR
jgi:hypothetical protein